MWDLDSEILLKFEHTLSIHQRAHDTYQYTSTAGAVSGSKNRKREHFWCIRNIQMMRKVRQTGKITVRINASSHVCLFWHPQAVLPSPHIKTNWPKYHCRTIHNYERRPVFSQKIWLAIKSDFRLFAYYVWSWMVHLAGWGGSAPTRASSRLQFPQTFRILQKLISSYRPRCIRTQWWTGNWTAATEKSQESNFTRLSLLHISLQRISVEYCTRGHLMGNDNILAIWTWSVVQLPSGVEII